MKIGVSLSNYGSLPSRSFLKDMSMRIEELQLDSIWVSDHVIVPKDTTPWNRVFESVTTLGFLASVTEYASLGFSVLLTPLREPHILAKQLSTLDSLSNGRVILGMGIGWNKEEFELLGCDFQNRADVAVKNISIMRKMWAGGYEREGFSCKPMPVSSHGPPILIGGQSPGALRRAALVGDGWHPVGITAQEYASGMHKIEKMKKQDFVWSLRIGFSAGQKIASRYVGADGTPRVRLVGSIDNIVSGIQEYCDIGLEHLVCDVNADSEEAYLEQLDLIGQVKKSF